LKGQPQYRELVAFKEALAIQLVVKVSEEVRVLKKPIDSGWLLVVIKLTDFFIVIELR
jgi:hypothetical protein